MTFPVDFFKHRGWLRIPQHNSTTGKLQVAGTNIDPYEFTLAEFNQLTASDYAGITVRVTNIHTTSAGVGGVLFTGGTTWTLESPYIYYATFDLLPAASLWPGARCLVGSGIGIGGAVVESRQISGTYYWRYRSGLAVIDATTADILHTTDFSVEKLIRSKLLPRNNGQCIMQNGDILAVRSVAARTAYVTSWTRNFKFGELNTTSDVQIETVAGGTNHALPEYNEFFRESATKLNILGPNSTNKWAGTSGSDVVADVTVTNMDSNNCYFHYTLKQSANTDEGVKLRKGYRIELIHAGG